MSAGHTLTNRRARGLAAALVALLASSATTVLAEHPGSAADQAAREILEARDRANAAAQAVFDADSRLDSLTIELAQAQSDLVEMEATVAALRDDLAESAVRQFVGATGPAIPLFSDVASSSQQAAAQVYRAAATESELVRADDYDAAVVGLEQARDDLERRVSETERARETHAELMAAAEAEVVRLQELENQRLRDVEVQRALERQRAERVEQDRLAAAAATQADADVSAAASGDGSTSSSGSSDSSGAAASGGGSGSSGSDSSSGSSGSDSSSGSSGSGTNSSGSSSSSSSSGSSSSSSGSPAPTPAPSGSGLVCPVAGPHGFADTWGAPRSGGRTHKGVDMIAAVGVPIVAVESGWVEFGQISNGALVARHWGDSGDYYFYGHFSAFEGSDRYVSRGEVIAYNGTTGTFTPHLHFEIHPNGGAAVNPYPYVRAVC